MALEQSHHGRDLVKHLRQRVMVAMWLTGVAFLILLGRLYDLQILRGEELSHKGKENFARRVRIPHDRGIIYDRYGKILVDNRASLDLYVTPAFLGDLHQREATLAVLSDRLGLDDEEREELRAKVEAKRRSGAKFQPILVARDLNPRLVEFIEAQRSVFLLDGVEIAEGRRRNYRYGKLAAHLLGYVNEIDAPALDRAKQKGNPRHYVLGDFIGRDGVERTHEEALRGRDGFERIVQDATGRRLSDPYFQNLLGPESRQEPRPGHNVYLTIDLELQRRAEAAFDGAAGAVVAMVPQTGEILALVSVPAFDPNLVSGALGTETKEELDNDPLKPWVNRTIQGQYAPGSTFKIATALAGLQTGTVTTREEIFCPGYYRMGRHTWRCHRDAGHGNVDLREALKVSCDTYFYTLAGRMGIEPIAAAARSLGMGKRLGIALRSEKPGLVPDEAFHDRVDRATGGYQRGMSVNTSIGQGSLLVTPMQLAVAYATVVNGGRVLQPKVVSRIETADFRVVRRFLGGAPRTIQEEIVGMPPQVLSSVTPGVLSALEASESHLEKIREGLVAVTSERGGTAYWRRSKNVSMGGKTGTAQVIRLGRERTKAEETPYEERDHAWFAAYAPAENPEIVVAVLNEHSGHGGSKAAPIATKVIDAYVELKAQRAAIAASDGTFEGRVP